DIRNYRDLPPIMCEQIAHFFQHYKDLEKGKWVTIVKWLDVTGAEKLILEAIARAEKARAKGHAGRRATRARTLPTGARRPSPTSSPLRRPIRGSSAWRHRELEVPVMSPARCSR